MKKKMRMRMRAMMKINMSSNKIKIGISKMSLAKKGIALMSTAKMAIAKMAIAKMAIVKKRMKENRLVIEASERMLNRSIQLFRALSEERGDVPGWVLVVLMTTGLVTGIWTLAAPRIDSILRNSLDSMSGIR